MGRASSRSGAASGGSGRSADWLPGAAGAAGAPACAPGPPGWPPARTNKSTSDGRAFSRGRSPTCIQVASQPAGRPCNVESLHESTTIFGQGLKKSGRRVGSLRRWVYGLQCRYNMWKVRSVALLNCQCSTISPVPRPVVGRIHPLHGSSRMRRNAAANRFSRRPSKNETKCTPNSSLQYASMFAPALERLGRYILRPSKTLSHSYIGIFSF